jgi:hypothetical protein
VLGLSTSTVAYSENAVFLLSPQLSEPPVVICCALSFFHMSDAKTVLRCGLRSQRLLRRWRHLRGHSSAWALAAAFPRFRFWQASQVSQKTEDFCCFLTTAPP